jgi:hypothetical protein
MPQVRMRVHIRALAVDSIPARMADSVSQGLGMRVNNTVVAIEHMVICGHVDVRFRLVVVLGNDVNIACAIMHSGRMGSTRVTTA